MLIAITTRAPSPYQVELFDALAAAGRFDLRVIYELRRGTGRNWDTPCLAHDHSFLEQSDSREIERVVGKSSLVIFSGYRNRIIRRLLSLRQRDGKPWVFWGERLGFRVAPSIGRYYRRMVIPELFTTNAAIWGIGGWAVQGYRNELSSRDGGRQILNVPYFSRLDRYLSIDRSGSIGSPRRILFSGSLVKRKGVDLLSQAFKELALGNRELELHLVGDGPLRQQLEGELSHFGARVKFYGFRQWDELPQYYANADILCAPSRHDGWGLVIPEGLAAGLLVVSTDKTGAALDLLDDRTGWTVRSGDRDALKQALTEAVEVSAEDRRRRIELGRTVARQQSIEAGIERVEAAISESLRQTEW